MLVFVIEDDERGIEVSKQFLKEGYYVSNSIKDLKYANLIYLGLKGIDNQNRIIHQGNSCIISDEYFKSIKEECIVFTIAENEYIKKLSNQYNFNYQSLLSDDYFLKWNTVMTTDGLISFMINKLNKPLYSSNVLILGYGNCAKDIAFRLKGFECKITIALRNIKYIDEIRENQYQHMLLEDLNFKNIDIIINTIPYPIINREELNLMDKDIIIFDIASFPYGIDHHNAIKLGFESYIIPAIPNHYFPKYSAKCIVEAMKRKGDNDA